MRKPREAGQRADNVEGWSSVSLFFLFPLILRSRNRRVNGSDDSWRGQEREGGEKEKDRRWTRTRSMRWQTLQTRTLLRRPIGRLPQARAVGTVEKKEVSRSRRRSNCPGQYDDEDWKNGSRKGWQGTRPCGNVAPTSGPVPYKSNPTSQEEPATHLHIRYR